MPDDEQQQSGFAFPKWRRLRRPIDFEAVYQLRQSARDRHLLVFARLRPGEPTRIGLSVSRKHGGAVRRGRLKRLLREGFRLGQHDVPNELDLILIPQRGATGTLDEYRESIRRLAVKLKRRLIERADAAAKDKGGDDERTA